MSTDADATSGEPSQAAPAAVPGTRENGFPGAAALYNQGGARPAVGTRLALATLLTTLALFLAFSPWPLYAKLHTIGRACCAQVPSHTISFAGQSMPIDARNSGIYLGVFLVIAMLWLTGRFRAGLYVPPTVRNILLGLTAAMILDGVNSFEHTHHLHAFYADSNALRAITGTLAGMSLTILVVPLFNRIVWRDPETLPIAADFTDLVGYLLGALLIILALLQAPAALYWPLSILSIAGLLITLTMVNTAIILVSLRREHTVTTAASLAIPALSGLVFTCGEIAMLNIWRAIPYH